MPTPLPEDQVSQLEQLLFKRRKIEAIKMYRELTGLGLKEAKDEMESLESSLRKAHPEKFSAPQSKGCGAAAAMCIAVVGVACWFMLR